MNDFLEKTRKKFEKKCHDLGFKEAKVIIDDHKGEVPHVYCYDFYMNGLKFGRQFELGTTDGDFLPISGEGLDARELSAFAEMSSYIRNCTPDSVWKFNSKLPDAF